MKSEIMALAEAAQVGVQVESVKAIAQEWDADEAMSFVGDDTYIVRNGEDYLVFTEYTTTDVNPTTHQLEHGEHSMLALAVAQALSLIVCGRIAKTIEVCGDTEPAAPAYLV